MNKKNLKVLADFLENHVKKKNFSMGTYFSSEQMSDSLHYKITKEDYDCGTVACALGHGPAAGFSKHKKEDWDQYAERVFGVDLLNDDVFYYMFGGEWSYTPYSKRKDAAKRIREVIKLGKAPVGWTYSKPY